MTAPPARAAARGAPGRSATEAVARVARVRRGRTRHRRLVITVLALLVAAAYAASLMVGHTVYAPVDVLRVILGQEVPGASFTVGVLRLPRASLAVLVGLCFGLGGVTFQTMLRNPLASPDIIGISSGAGAAAVFGIIVLGLDGAAVSLLAIVSGLVIAMLVYLLAYRHGTAGTRLILIGIGLAAMLDSVTAYLLDRAPEWELQEAMRWLTGSLNGADWQTALPVLLALVTGGPALVAQTRNLAAVHLGDDAAAALGVRIERTRVIAVVAAVGLVAFATAATGPIAFVAFLSGPIAARIVGPRGSMLLPAALVGALLVLVADLGAQWALGTRFPVGVVTGVLGAPYLLYLIVRTNRTGGAL
ncbi:iron ABC transporter permease [Georgenia halophila]|uniref:Iron ABC transporter permease n=1 Tax=Georgenia halophila TaxID=620889 RepID=A0ABP8LTM5_9MICO